MVKTKHTTKTVEDELVVSPEEAERLVREVRDGDLYTDDGAVAAFLLLLHSMAYCEAGDRENYLRAAERVLMTYTLAFQEGSEKLRRVASDSLRGVKRVEVKLKPKTK